MTPEQVAINNQLRLLSEDWQLDCLKLDRHGRCHLQTETGLPLVIEVPKGLNYLLISADIGRLPENNTEACLKQLMSMNITDESLGLAYFGLNPATERLCLRYHYPAESLNEERLGNMISRFIEIAARVASELKTPAVHSDNADNGDWVKI